MSREDLKTFIHAIEHNLTLREKLRACHDVSGISNLASKYGFSIAKKDLEEDNYANKAIKYFKDNKISTIKKHISQ